MAVSANHELGGCVILLRLYLIDMVQKNYRGFQGYRPFQEMLLLNYTVFRVLSLFYLLLFYNVNLNFVHHCFTMVSKLFILFPRH